MTFFEAMKELEKGKKVRKVHWDTNYYIAYNKEDNTFIDENSHIVVDSIYLNSDKWELYKEDILTEKEKEYLSNILEPFRGRIMYIKKKVYPGAALEYINIAISNQFIILNGEDYLRLPAFSSGTMYKNMQPGKEYTLEELGFYD